MIMKNINKLPREIQWKILIYVSNIRFSKDELLSRITNVRTNKIYKTSGSYINTLIMDRKGNNTHIIETEFEYINFKINSLDIKEYNYCNRRFTSPLYMNMDNYVINHINKLLSDYHIMDRKSIYERFVKEDGRPFNRMRKIDKINLLKLCIYMD